ncbi:hypothetical protein, partial [Catenulispora pinistramenti]|uniref:hypothetical protein n=1 Tax=Catenulispora pinistramenti TaxID=2705254 RepID=UPI001E3C919B
MQQQLFQAVVVDGDQALVFGDAGSGAGGDVLVDLRDVVGALGRCQAGFVFQGLDRVRPGRGVLGVRGQV